MDDENSVDDQAPVDDQDPVNGDDSIKDVDPQSLKALAHPLRIRLLALLRTEGPATSAGLARRVDESTGATSYHLRQLARHGFVTEVPERGTRRERWWQASHRLSRFDSAPPPDDPATAEAVRLIMRTQSEVQTRLVRRWLDEQSSWSQAWQHAAASNDWMIRLTDEQLAALNADMKRVVDRYRAAEAAPETPGAEPVAVFVHAFPTDLGAL